MLKRPLVVLAALMFAALACYSDSPLWFSELTPPAPTITPLPLPQQDQARLQAGDIALVPEAAVGAAFRFDLTTVPEPLAADLSNKSPQSCSKNSIVRILYSGVDESNIVYQLVDCSGVVGWTPEFNLLGPISIRVNERALTTESGLNDSNRYVVELTDPPYAEGGAVRQQADCRVNDTVDVVDVKGLTSGDVYYKIRCTNPINPVVPNVGWVLDDHLFGPVRFRNGEVGIVPQSLDTLELTAEPDSGEVVAACQSNEQATITTTPVQRIDDSLFYEVTCADGVGWTNQNQLVGPVPYAIADRVLVTTPGVDNSAEVAVVPDETNPDIEAVEPIDGATPEPTPQAEIILTAITENPEPLTLDNAIATCEDATVTTIDDFAGVDDTLYAQVTCGDVLGWVNVSRLFGTVEYAVGDTVQLGDKALLGFNQRGIYLSRRLFDIEGPSGGSSVIAGECAYDFDAGTLVDAQLVDVGYYRASTREIVGVFYLAECQDVSGATIQGWINQDRIGE